MGKNFQKKTLLKLETGTGWPSSRSVLGSLEDEKNTALFFVGVVRPLALYFWKSGGKKRKNLPYLVKGGTTRGAAPLGQRDSSLPSPTGQYEGNW